MLCVSSHIVGTSETAVAVLYGFIDSFIIESAKHASRQISCHNTSIK